jgi:hypothetical protein
LTLAPALSAEMGITLDSFPNNPSSLKIFRRG